MVRVRDAHFYRKVPYDVSEGTKLGGLVSAIGILTIMWLVREEFADFSMKKRITKLTLSTPSAETPIADGPGGDEIRINFNMIAKKGDDRKEHRRHTIHDADGERSRKRS